MTCRITFRHLSITVYVCKRPQSIDNNKRKHETREETGYSFNTYTFFEYESRCYLLDSSVSLHCCSPTQNKKNTTEPYACVKQGKRFIITDNTS